jgi:hypothetical protein
MTSWRDVAAKQRARPTVSNTTTRTVFESLVGTYRNDLIGECAGDGRDQLLNAFTQNRLWDVPK